MRNFPDEEERFFVEEVILLYYSRAYLELRDTKAYEP